MKNESTNERYAAMLLFQWRVMVDGNPGKRRLCEKRILNFRAQNAKKALAEAKKRGKEAEYKAENEEGNPFYFEFIGVLDLQSLGQESDEDEVWYDVVQMLNPMERRSHLIPDESCLSAIRNENPKDNNPRH